jgi:hypothetical protein
MMVPRACLALLVALVVARVAAAEVPAARPSPPSTVRIAASGKPE